MRRKKLKIKDYLYPMKYFVRVELPPEAIAALPAATTTSSRA